MFTLNDISVYIFNWKKVSKNSLLLYNNISNIIKDTYIINCDENLIITDNNVKHIQLDDSHYYGSQYNTAVKHVKDNSILCVIVGDNIVDNNFEKIFNNAIETFNNYNVGVYSPHDKRSHHQTIINCFNNYLYNVENTDCGFWFIHPNIIKKLKSIDYNISKYGWGIDCITIKEAKKQSLLIIRDYSITTDQLDHTCGYDTNKAGIGWRQLEYLYSKLN